MNTRQLTVFAWIIFGASLPLLVITPAWAQDNYEIQVYGSDLVAPQHTMVELHSNFTVEGSKTTVDGVLPTNHAEHETVEITQGFTDWFVFSEMENGISHRGADTLLFHPSPAIVNK